MGLGHHCYSKHLSRDITELNEIGDWKHPSLLGPLHLATLQEMTSAIAFGPSAQAPSALGAAGPASFFSGCSKLLPSEYRGCHTLSTSILGGSLLGLLGLPSLSERTQCYSPSRCSPPSDPLLLSLASALLSHLRLFHT